MSSKYSKKAQDGILHYVESNEDVIHDAACSSVGISSWFQEYIVSDVFQNLPNDSKRKAFHLYEMLQHTLQRLDDVTAYEMNTHIKN